MYARVLIGTRAISDVIKNDEEYVFLSQLLTRYESPP